MKCSCCGDGGALIIDRTDDMVKVLILWRVNFNKLKRLSRILGPFKDSDVLLVNFVYVPRS